MNPEEFTLFFSNLTVKERHAFARRFNNLTWTK